MARIAIILPNLKLGGAERVRLLLAGAFIKLGYAVDLVLMEEQGELLAEIPAGVKVIVLNATRFRRAFFPLLQYIRATRPDAVLGAMWPGSGLAVVATRLAFTKARVVVSEHTNISHSRSLGSLGRISHRILGPLVYRWADGVAAVSSGVAADLAQRAFLRPGRVKAILNPFNSSRRPQEPNVDTLRWWRQGGARLIAVGSLKPAKDYPTMIMALAELPLRDARLLVLGEGRLLDELERLAQSLGVADRLRFAGFTTDVFPYLAHADVFVLSSAWEGLPNVIIEALASGVPVVSTDCHSGPSEILSNGKYGRLVPVGDPAALASAVAETLKNHHDRDLLRLRAAEFSIERAAYEYLALLDPAGKVLGKK